MRGQTPASECIKIVNAFHVFIDLKPTSNTTVRVVNVNNAL
jgi:hypothetical protein